MNKAYFVIAFLLVTVSVQAQKYVPFPKHGAVWRESFTDATGPQSDYNYHIKQEGDTIINKVSYTLLSTVSLRVFIDLYGEHHYTYGKGLYGAMREDSFKHVYFYDFGNKKEYLLYDFDMKVGDTLPNYISVNKNYGIITIDSILYENSYRKQYGVGMLADSVPFAYIIEGVGSTQGLANRIVRNLETFYTLECFSVYDKSLYPETGYACELITNVSAMQEKQSNIKIFLNPTSGQFTIQTQSIFNESNICVRDVLGRIVLQEKLQSPNQTINIANQPKGLYFVELRTGNKSGIQKLILQ